MCDVIGMSVTPDDWRLQGQERFLKGASLKLTLWSTPNPEWDHDHCEFCWIKFGKTGMSGAIQQGYVTDDLKHWICPQCFQDFRERFEWVDVG